MYDPGIDGKTAIKNKKTTTKQTKKSHQKKIVLVLAKFLDVFGVLD